MSPGRHHYRAFYWKKKEKHFPKERNDSGKVKHFSSQWLQWKRSRLSCIIPQSKSMGFKNALLWLFFVFYSCFVWESPSAILFLAVPKLRSLMCLDSIMKVFFLLEVQLSFTQNKKCHKVASPSPAAIWTDVETVGYLKGRGKQLDWKRWGGEHAVGIMDSCKIGIIWAVVVEMFPKLSSDLTEN